MKKFPLITKNKRSHKIKTIKGKKGFNLHYFSTGIRLNKTKYFSYSTFEATRVALTKLVKPKEIKNKKNLKLIKSARRKSRNRARNKKSRQKKFMIMRSNLCVPVTKKPLQVRMGKGKGLVDHWAHVGRKSRVILEISRQRLKLRKIFRLFKKATTKLPVHVKPFYNRYFMRRETNFRHNRLK